MEVKRYSFALDNKGQDEHLRLATDADVDAILAGHDDGKLISPSEHLHELTRLELDRFPKMSYVDALSRVQDRNPKLVALYASETNGRIRVA